MTEPVAATSRGCTEDSFQEFFLTTFPRARSVAMRLGISRQAAEDAAIIALARAYSQWDRISLLPYRQAWALRVAVNAACDEARRDRRARRGDQVPVSDDQTSEVDLRQTLVGALRHLSSRQREVLVLHYIGDLTFDEVALSLGCSVGTVKKHAHRAREQLRADLGSDEFVALADPDTRERIKGDVE